LLPTPVLPQESKRGFASHPCFTTGKQICFPSLFYHKEAKWGLLPTPVLPQGSKGGFASHPFFTTGKQRAGGCFTPLFHHREAKGGLFPTPVLPLRYPLAIAMPSSRGGRSEAQSNDPKMLQKVTPAASKTSKIRGRNPPKRYSKMRQAPPSNHCIVNSSSPGGVGGRGGSL